MQTPVMYNFRRCPYAMRARLAIASSNTRIELREIVLREKPPQMLLVSPKATVPVLIDADKIIDESYDIMLWALNNNDPENWLRHVDTELILHCDGPFKHALDRYKYSNRYADGDPDQHRDDASVFLFMLDRILENQPTLGGQEYSLTDMAILTFVRQFANVNRAWFDNQPWDNLISWLQTFLASKRFLSIMTKYPQWHENDPVTYFPESA